MLLFHPHVDLDWLFSSVYYNNHTVCAHCADCRCRLFFFLGVWKQNLGWPMRAVQQPPLQITAGLYGQSNEESRDFREGRGLSLFPKRLLTSIHGGDRDERYQIKRHMPDRYVYSLSLECACELVSDANAFSRGNRVYILEPCCMWCYIQIHTQYTWYAHRRSRPHCTDGSVWTLRPDDLCSNLTSLLLSFLEPCISSLISLNLSFLICKGG